jgi:hypothetical protein
MADDRSLGERELDVMAVLWARVARLVDDRDVSPAELQKLAAQLDKRGSRRKGTR